MFAGFMLTRFCHQSSSPEIVVFILGTKVPFCTMVEFVQFTVGYSLEVQDRVLNRFYLFNNNQIFGTRPSITPW
jgi:hypothetical protein